MRKKTPKKQACGASTSEAQVRGLTFTPPAVNRFLLQLQGLKRGTKECNLETSVSKLEMKVRTILLAWTMPLDRFRQVHRSEQQHSPSRLSPSSHPTQPAPLDWRRLERVGRGGLEWRWRGGARWRGRRRGVGRVAPSRRSASSPSAKLEEIVS